MTAESPSSAPQLSPARRALFYAIPVILTWLLIEIALTVLDPVLFNKGFFIYDPDLGFRVRPGAANSNHLGFNDIEHTPIKAPGTYRITLVGDSYNWVGTNGPPRSDKDMNYTAIVQRLFDAHYGPHLVEIVNVGFPATHTAEELAILKKYGLQEKPDLLVLGFYAGNDFFDGAPYRKRIIVDGLYMDIDRRHEMKFLGFPIILQSRLLMLLKEGWATMTAVNHHGAPAGEFTKSTYDDMVNNYLHFFDKTRLAKGELTPNIQYILGALYDMADLMKQDGIDFKVAVYPCEEQIDKNLFHEVVQVYRLNPQNFDLDQVQKLVDDACQHRNIPVLDMLPDFRAAYAAHPNQRLYLLRNTHWNDQGNTLAANLMFKFLQPTVDAWFKSQGIAIPAAR